ncbi:MAG: hypothetical protein QOG17_933 [Gammaproteobacteria bacterium]|jgi:hypothetical protein|nr:hypothetical protein [Gammaproteobacteria bacterium]
MEKLTQLLLAELAKIEAALVGEGSTHVLPAVDGMNVENGIRIPGFDHDQINDRLRQFVRRGIVDTGGFTAEDLLLGIMFRQITSAGRQMMSRAA